MAAGVLVWFIAVYVTQELAWQTGRDPHGAFESLLSLVAVAWALPMLPALIGVVGFITYRERHAKRGPVTKIPNVVSFRIVSRGENVEALRKTIDAARHSLAEVPLFPYLIEVVTDLPVLLAPCDDLVHLVVPVDYQTPNGSKFKARALQYALEVSELPDDVWIMHLDEESHLTTSVVYGIRDAISEEEASGRHRIGQGAVLYHRHVRRQPFLTLADSIRTGDDVGRFYFQHRLGLTLFGLHGSFILVRNDVEKEVGFDFGPHGSITEDAFWALKSMENGRRCRWVDGYVKEQPPQNVRDFVKQRRRWFIGLVKVCLHAPVGFRYRAALSLSTSLWSISWIGVLYTYVNLGVGLAVPTWIQVTGDLAFASYIMTYLVGLKINLDNEPPMGRIRATYLYAAQVLLIPVFSILEGAAIAYALVRPDTDFHVVNKDAGGSLVTGLRAVRVAPIATT